MSSNIDVREGDKSGRLKVEFESYKAVIEQYEIKQRDLITIAQLHQQREQTLVRENLNLQRKLDEYFQEQYPPFLLRSAKRLHQRMKYKSLHYRWKKWRQAAAFFQRRRDFQTNKARKFLARVLNAWFRRSIYQKHQRMQIKSLRELKAYSQVVQQYQDHLAQARTFTTWINYHQTLLQAKGHLQRYHQINRLQSLEFILKLWKKQISFQRSYRATCLAIQHLELRRHFTGWKHCLYVQTRRRYHLKQCLVAKHYRALRIVVVKWRLRSKEIEIAMWMESILVARAALEEERVEWQKTRAAADYEIQYAIQQSQAQHDQLCAQTTFTQQQFRLHFIQAAVFESFKRYWYSMHVKMTTARNFHRVLCRRNASRRFKHWQHLFYHLKLTQKRLEQFSHSRNSRVQEKTLKIWQLYHTQGRQQREKLNQIILKCRGKVLGAKFAQWQRNFRRDQHHQELTNFHHIYLQTQDLTTEKHLDQLQHLNNTIRKVEALNNYYRRKFSAVVLVQVFHKIQVRSARVHFQRWKQMLSRSTRAQEQLHRVTNISKKQQQQLAFSIWRDQNNKIRGNQTQQLLLCLNKIYQWKASIFQVQQSKHHKRNQMFYLWRIYQVRIKVQRSKLSEMYSRYHRRIPLKQGFQRWHLGILLGNVLEKEKETQLQKQAYICTLITQSQQSLHSCIAQSLLKVVNTTLLLHFQKWIHHTRYQQYSLQQNARIEQVIQKSKCFQHLQHFNHQRQLQKYFKRREIAGNLDNLFKKWRMFIHFKQFYRILHQHHLLKRSIRFYSENLQYSYSLRLCFQKWLQHLYIIKTSRHEKWQQEFTILRLKTTRFRHWQKLVHTKKIVLRLVTHGKRLWCREAIIHWKMMAIKQKFQTLILEIKAKYYRNELLSSLHIPPTLVLQEWRRYAKQQRYFQHQITELPLKKALRHWHMMNAVTKHWKHLKTKAVQYQLVNNLKHWEKYARARHLYKRHVREVYWKHWEFFLLLQQQQRTFREKLAPEHYHKRLILHHFQTFKGTVLRLSSQRKRSLLQCLTRLEGKLTRQVQERWQHWKHQMQTTRLLHHQQYLSVCFYRWKALSQCNAIRQIFQSRRLQWQRQVRRTLQAKISQILYHQLRHKLFLIYHSEFTRWQRQCLVKKYQVLAKVFKQWQLHHNYYRHLNLLSHYFQLSDRKKTMKKSFVVWKTLWQWQQNLAQVIVNVHAVNSQRRLGRRFFRKWHFQLRHSQNTKATIGQFVFNLQHYVLRTALATWKVWDIKRKWLSKLLHTQLRTEQLSHGFQKWRKLALYCSHQRLQQAKAQAKFYHRKYYLYVNHSAFALLTRTRRSRCFQAWRAVFVHHQSRQHSQLLRYFSFYISKRKRFRQWKLFHQQIQVFMRVPVIFSRFLYRAMLSRWHRHAHARTLGRHNKQAQGWAKWKMVIQHQQHCQVRDRMHAFVRVSERYHSRRHLHILGAVLHATIAVDNFFLRFQVRQVLGAWRKWRLWMTKSIRGWQRYPQAFQAVEKFLEKMRLIVGFGRWKKLTTAALIHEEQLEHDRLVLSLDLIQTYRERLHYHHRTPPHEPSRTQLSRTWTSNDAYSGR